MAKNYAGLTGESMLKTIKAQNRRSVFFCILGLVICAGAAVFLLLLAGQNQRYLTAIIGLLMTALFCWLLLTSLKNALGTLKDCRNAKVFRKFGEPETIAARIAAESAEPLLPSNEVLIADSFIMNYTNFESYVPYSEVLLCYKKEQRTNGILTAIYLVVHDIYGDQFSYRFKTGKKHADEMINVMKHISEQAPQAAFGYTQENLQYAAANAKKLEG